MKLIEENKLWAGLVFVDFPEDSDSDELPEVCTFVTRSSGKSCRQNIYTIIQLMQVIKYKIRLDSDKVDSTRYLEDRLPRPGPRRRPGIDLKYLYYGFAYLQVG